MRFTIDPDDDPNEAYDVVPMPEEPHGPRGWWSVTANGIPVWHFGAIEKARQYATDAAHRLSMVKDKAWERK